MRLIASSSSGVASRVRTEIGPPVCIASRALTTRFITTCSIWPRSDAMGGRPAASSTFSSIIRAEQPRQHLLHVADDGADLQRLRLEHLLAAESEELARETRGAIARGKNVLERLARGSPGGTSSSMKLALPPIVVSRLLKSCAMPPASRPSASILCACCTSSPSRRRCVFHLPGDR